MSRTLKLFILFFFLCTAAAYALFYSPESTLENTSPVEALKENIFAEEPEELQYAILLEKLSDMSFPENEEGLLLLSQREDAVGYRASLTLAREYVQNGQEAEKMYEHALYLHESREVKKEFASYLRKKGREKKAQEKYFSVLPDYNAAEALVNMNVPPAEIGNFLYENSYYSALTNFLEPYLEKEKEASQELKYLYTTGLVNTGSYEKALPYLKELVENDENNSRVKEYYARSLEETGEPEKALKIYETIEPRGNYARGNLLYARGDEEKAAQALARAPEEEARWWSARLFEEMGQSSEALSLYIELAREEGNLKFDAAYRTYLLLSEKEDPRAEDFLDKLSQEPAWMHRLGNEPAFEEEETLPQVEPSFIDRAQAYKESDRDDLGSLEILIGEYHASAEELFALGTWHLDRRDYFKAVRTGMELLKEHKDPKVYKLAFPRPYMEEVKEAADDYGIDPHLLLAVMREESHFRPAVISAADARGLMQVMPATARDIAERKGIEIELEELFDPQVNIRLGAFYLRSMLDSFNEDPDKALAAYNAGPNNARRWNNSPLAQKSGGFPTAVTFKETREYINRVMNSYLTYKWLYTS